MNFTSTITHKNRIILKRFLEQISLADLNKIPEGFSNNIIWNIAHVVVTQQLLTYKLSGLPMHVSEELVSKYRNKTKPEGDVTQAEVDEINGLLESLLIQTEKDLAAGIFKTYTEYTVSLGTTLTNVQEAIEFNNFHEGIHLGYILALRKAI
ncbi:DinB family protein [Kordia sp. YSTF-M3]|uniref:DinB family protein n=1 Tax=Kordia aestuariivivens TaxID=2759037 RepID=A0ABR7Q6N5_9FLAO|nr:DinB family protein [Kordia aestuariivivens]MBC8754225.1 DinB family protein [Kordia aestuariivivens]